MTSFGVTAEASLPQDWRIWVMTSAIWPLCSCWPNGGMPFPQGAIRTPEDFAEIAKLVRPENYKNRMIISPDMDEHREQIQQFVDLGFDEIHVHNVGRNQKEFIEVFSRQVIAKLKL